jgi:hypothetical protein
MADPMRDDDPRRELRVAGSAGVDWPSILAVALDLWLPDDLSSRAGEIGAAVRDATAGDDHIAVVLWREGDDAVAGVGSDPELSATDATVRVIGRWSSARSA